MSFRLCDLPFLLYLTLVEKATRIKENSSDGNSSRFFRARGRPVLSYIGDIRSVLRASGVTGASLRLGDGGHAPGY